MQRYPLSLDAGNNYGRVIQFQGNGFWFVNGDPEIEDADTHIVLRPDTGDEVYLKPGQSVRLNKLATTWNISSLAGGGITGEIIIGNGDFADSNTTNSVSIESVVGTVPVSGPDGDPVVVEIDTTSGAVAVALEPGASVTESPITITNSHAATGNIGANTSTAILLPAANVNGVVLLSAFIEKSTLGHFTLLAKASAVTGQVDGTVLIHIPQAAAAGEYFELPARLKVPAGMGLYMWTNNTMAIYRAINLSVL